MRDDFDGGQVALGLRVIDDLGKGSDMRGIQADDPDTQSGGIVLGPQTLATQHNHHETEHKDSALHGMNSS